VVEHAQMRVLQQSRVSLEKNRWFSRQQIPQVRANRRPSPRDSRGNTSASEDARWSTTSSTEGEEVGSRSAPDIDERASSTRSLSVSRP
jgi:hypothetical protein